MRLLVIHQNFPGQFGHMVREWAKRPGWDVRGLGRESAPGLPGFRGLARYRLARGGRPQQHPYLRQMESATLHGQAVARALVAMKRGGFVPDVILAHPGWGETLFAKEVFPDARLVHLCEWYYGGTGGDFGFDPEFPIDFDTRARARNWNALHALNLTQCDVAVSPTHWQKRQHPEIFHPKIEVIHEGVASDVLAPDPHAAITLQSGLTLRAGDPVVTYVARNLEPYRGFHSFMRALERVQKRDRRVHALIVGGDDTSYGAKAKSADGSTITWRERMLREVAVDPARTHFLGRVPYADYVRVLQVSAAHVYLTYPFVLSWSMLEAMACGAFVIGSDTAPVREVLTDGKNGRLVGFFDPEAIAEAVLEGMHQNHVAARAAARALVGARYGRSNGIMRYERLLGAAPVTAVHASRVRDAVALP